MIALTTPDSPVAGKDHSTVLHFGLRNVQPATVTMGAEVGGPQPAVLTVTLVDVVRTGPGAFTALRTRDIVLTGPEVSALAEAEANHIRAMRRAIEDLLAAQNTAPGVATND